MIVILFLILGLLMGWRFRPRGRALKVIHQALTLAIWILLFFMGMDIGSDKTVLGQWSRIGGDAVVIAVSSLLGSFGAGYLLWKRVMQK
ncbi:MAG TPA: LysO family transporter [Candidatus Mcinerneyibacteriales bacterium]|nr:LysO family transporter [Candidatus Mcinerneyibacteriales bacterium]